MPTDSELAKLNKIHYLSQGGVKKQAKAMRKAERLGYETVSTKRGVAHFKNKTDGHHVVTIKGTDPTNSKDIVSDLKLAVGLSSSDKQFKKRTNEIKKIYAANPDGDKFLTGHSLGASVVTRAMAKSKTVRDGTKHATTFNTGYTPAFHAEMSGDKKVNKILKHKLTHIHQKGDPISAALTIDSVGSTKTIKKASSSPHSLDNFVDEKE